MIREAVFENFRALRDVKLRLGPLTALVGPNASGKSTILRGLSPGRGCSFPDDSFQRRVDLPVSRSLTLDNGTVFEQRWDGSKWSEKSDVRRLEHKFLRLDPVAIARPNTAASASVLVEDGRNLTNVFATLPKPSRLSISLKLCEVVPVFSDIDLNPVNQGLLEIRFQDRWAPDVWYPAREVSDGTLLALAFLVVQYQAGPVDVLAVEEPERSLHPYLMSRVVGLLREIATGSVGPRPVQVVLATHSADLLDALRPEEVRFLGRARDGSVQVEEAPTTSPDWEKSFDEYRHSLRSMYLSGGLGGVPETIA